MDIRDVERNLASDDVDTREAAAAAFNNLANDDLAMLISKVDGSLTRSETLNSAVPASLFVAVCIATGFLMSVRLAVEMSMVVAYSAVFILMSFGIKRVNRRTKLMSAGVCEGIDRLTEGRHLATLLTWRAHCDDTMPNLSLRLMRNSPLKEAVDRYIRRVAPEAPPSQMRAISTRELKMLFSYWLSEPYDDVDATLRCLRLLGEIGDPRLLGRVRALTDEGAATANMRTVRDAARACLAVCAEHETDAAQQRTLLRPSNNAVVQPETLLRAAAHVDETPAEQLLRPTQQAPE